ncbi:quinon protein alcohol dehydrogenase-like superfamily, partial [Baffinella frigidus]
GDTLVTAGSGGEVVVWDVPTGDCHARFGAGAPGGRSARGGERQRRVLAVALEPSCGWLLAVASSAGDILFYDVGAAAGGQGEPLAQLGAHTQGVTALGFSATGDKLLAACASGTIRVFSLHLPEGARYLGSTPWSEDRAAASCRSKLLSPFAAGTPDAGGGADRGFSVRGLHTLVGHSEGVRHAAFSPSGAHLASASLDGTLRIWSLGSGVQKVSVQVAGPAGSSPGCLAWAPDGVRIATGGDDGAVRVMDVRAGKQTAAMQARRTIDTLMGITYDSLSDGSAAWDLRPVDGHRRPITCVAFTPDGKALLSASSDGTVKAWDADRGTLLRTILRCPPGGPVGGVRVRCMVVEADGARVLAGCSDGMVRAARIPPVDSQAPDPLEVDEPPPSPAPGANGAHGTGKRRKSRDGEELGEKFGVGEDGDPAADEGVARAVWPQRFRTGARVLRVAHSGSDALAASAAAGSTTVHLRHPGTLAVVHSLEGHVGAVTDVAAGEGGALVASASMDGHVRVWDVAAGVSRLAQPCFRQGATSVDLEGVLSIVAAGSAIGDIQVVDLATGATRVEWSGGDSPVVSLAFAHQGRYLAYAYSTGMMGIRDLRDPNGGIILQGQEAALGLGATFLRFSGMKKEKGQRAAETAGMCCSPDGSFMARALGDVVQGWDARAPGSLLYTDTHHNGTVHSVRMLDHGRRVASGGIDGSVRLWSVPAAPGSEAVTVSNGSRYVPLTWARLKRE